MTLHAKGNVCDVAFDDRGWGKVSINKYLVIIIFVFGDSFLLKVVFIFPMEQINNRGELY